MEELVKYVRIAPFDKKKGQRVRRYVIGSRLFVGGKWYRMPLTWAKRLSELRQSGGAPVFEVMSEEDFKETSRRELAAAMRAAGLEGLAMGEVAQLPLASTPKVGARESSFASLEQAPIDEVDLSKAEPGEVAAEAVDAAKSGEVEKKVDLESMQRADLIALADNWGVPLPEGASVARIRSLLGEYL